MSPPRFHLVPSPGRALSSLAPSAAIVFSAAIVIPSASRLLSGSQTGLETELDRVVARETARPGRNGGPPGCRG